MKLKRNIVEVIGWYGVGAIILAYALVSFSIVSPESWSYQLLNLTGAIGIIIEATAKKDRQPVILNIFWALIAATALLQLSLA